MSKILVTGIGGVVGQGILKNIRAEYPKIPLIGVNVLPVSAGNYLCDKVFEVPFGDQPGYLDQILRLIKEEDISLIIPSTDLEAYVLGANQQLLSAPVAISSPEVSKFCLDKYDTYLALEKYKIPFASSSLPSAYANEWNDCIVKPRTGRGSRGIQINPSNVRDFDDSFLVQELLEGIEITTACYVTKQRKVHSFITFKRELDNGNTNKAEVTFRHDQELSHIIHSLVERFDFKGSFNIQSMVTSKGIVPFEINCRISGTNSIRPHFGFKDVKWTVQEWLLNETPEPPVLTEGCAMRVIDDLIYPGLTLSEVANHQDVFIKA